MLKSLVVTASLLAAIPAQAESYLFMAEEAGCYWCAQWHAEIGPVYPKTDEGQVAPLVRYNLRSDDPDIDLARRVTYTPTFVLVTDGKEVGRIEGYPGEDFFWGLLGLLIEDANISESTQS